MGFDCKITLSNGASKKDVQEFLTILGYEKYDQDYYVFYDRKGREQISGVSATISNKSPIQVDVHTSVWRSIKDHEVLNWTIKQLSKRFGGSFHSSEGKNRYLRFDGVVRRQAEAGCNLAYFEFCNNISSLQGFLMILKDSEPNFTINKYTSELHPLLTSVNIGLPFLITILEEYLRGCYVSLLNFSPFKKEIFKKSNIQAEELLDVAQHNLTIEELISRYKSFQNVDSINRNFKELHKDLSFINSLNKNRFRRNYVERLKEIINLRHNVIHHFLIDYEYTIKNLQKDLNTIEGLVKIFQDRIIEVHKWNSRDW